MQKSNQQLRSKHGTLAELDVIRYADVPVEKLDEYLKVVLENYERATAKRGLTLLSRPYAAVQDRLFDTNKDIIVRAVVRPTRRTNGKSKDN